MELSYKLDAITLFFQQDLVPLFLGLFLFMSGLVAMSSVIGKFSILIGRPVKWVRSKNEDHQLLIKTSQNLSLLQEKQENDMEQSYLHDEEMRKDIRKLTDLFVDKQIDDMRWEINNFATQVSENRPCNKDSFQHCIHTWEKYEKLLSDHGMENGEVELSMELVKDAYRKKMKDGF